MLDIKRIKENPDAENIMPMAFDKSVADKVAKAVAKAAISDGVARIK